eukprot:m51a1_g6553 hypothetical protein (1223) ;mRNA; r:90065-96419
MRVVISGSACKDLYATPRVYSDAQFMFREVPALDGGSGVSIMPAANPGYYLCSDGTGSGRICSFNKVAGLSNPSLVSFEQGGQYIGYAKAYDYDCASWFTNYNYAGWTVGLVDKPSTLTLATWISADAGPVRLYIQDTSYWLGNCGGSAFFTTSSGDTEWNAVAALSNTSSTTLYNSASDTSLAMRTAISGTCKDLYATTRVYSDAQFMFREVAALDGTSDVSIMPAANPGYFLCSDGTGSGRIVAVVQSALNSSLCSFNKVAGLSNPSLVSFEQGGQYIGYAKAFDYDCASWFTNYDGWTVGLVDKPSTLTLATWISADAGPVKPYIQDTNYWLGNCGGNAFFSTSTGDIAWNAVAALSNTSSTTLISLQLYSNTSLYLGIDADGELQIDNSSETYVPLRAMNCTGREALCTWTIITSTSASGDFNLELAGTNRTLDRQSSGSSLTCKTTSYGAASLYLSSAATLGFWRSTYSIPATPAVIVNTTSSSESASCSDYTMCRTCITTSMSCGWCAETGVCSQGTASSPSNCSTSKWHFDSCVAATNGGGSSTSIVAPLVGGIVGGVAVLSAVVAAAVLVGRSLQKRKAAPLNMPVEGASVDFTATVSQEPASSASPVATIQFSGSVGGSGVAGSNSSGSGPIGALPSPMGMALPQMYDISLAPVVSIGKASFEMPQIPLPLGSLQMLCFLVLLTLLATPAVVCASVFTQYNSASDTSLALRVAIGGTCKDLYATTRVYADAQFMFREVAALDGGSGVSIMPAPNPGYYLCSDGTGSGRICSFNKVAGLSNPSLVSFEQGGQYIGYFKAFDYDCASWFTNYNYDGWTVGLVDKPSTLTLATWVSADAGPVRLYIQGYSYWLGNCGGSAFFSTSSGDVKWNAVAALSNTSSTTLVSFQLYSYTSLYLGIDEEGEREMNDSSVDYVPLKAVNCTGRESECTWTIVMSSLYSGDFNLKITGTSRTLGRQTSNNTLSCATTNYGAANLYLSTAAELGLWRATYTIPATPAVTVNSTSSDAASCSDYTMCRTCITTSMSCGWCAETGVCSEGTSSSPSNCSKSKWYFESCTASSTNDGSTNLVAPLVGGIVGGVAVLSAVVVAAVLVTRSLHNRKPAVLNIPVEGASVDFTATAMSSRDLAMTDTVSPLTIQLSGSTGGALPSSNSSGSGPLMALSLQPVYDISLVHTLSGGNMSLEMPQVPPPLGGDQMGSPAVGQSLSPVTTSLASQ